MLIGGGHYTLLKCLFGKYSRKPIFVGEARGSKAKVEKSNNNYRIIFFSPETIQN